MIWKAKRKEPKGNKKNTENVNEKKKQISKKSLASSRGLVVKAEDSGLKGRGLKPPLRRPFFRHHSFGSKA